MGWEGRLLARGRLWLWSELAEQVPSGAPFIRPRLDRGVYHHPLTLSLLHQVQARLVTEFDAFYMLISATQASTVSQGCTIIIN